MRNGGACDVFLSYSRADSASAETLRLRLKEAGLDAFLDRYHLPAGQPWQPWLEEQLVSCRALVVLVGPLGFGEWQHREIQLGLDRQASAVKMGQAFPVIPVLLPGLAKDDVPVGSFLSLNTWVDLRPGLDESESLQRLVAGAQGRAINAAAEKLLAGLAPYRGLLPFREQDAGLFFGRERFVEELVRKVSQPSATNVVAVLGRSGSGKSSIVFAGLFPALRRERAVTYERSVWQILHLRPYNEPLQQLAYAFDPPRGEPNSIAFRAQLNKAAQFFRDRKLTVAQLVRDRLRDDRGSTRLLLYIDQWEELYTLVAPREPKTDEERARAADAKLFIDLVLEAAAKSDCTLVLSVRSDFYPDIQSHDSLRVAVQGSQVSLGTMNEAELRAVIEGPPKALGASVDAQLTEKLIRDMGLDPASGRNDEYDIGKLPLLEYALEQAWAKRTGPRIGLGDYSGLEQALEERANALYRRLSVGDQTAAKRLFVSLVSPGEGREDTRARIDMPDDSAMRSVIQTFAGTEARLITTDKAGERGSVEVSHEALIRHWRELRQWIDVNRENLRTRARLKEDRTEWLKRNYAPELLGVPSLRLREVQKLSEEPGDVRIDDIKDYIDALLDHDRQRKDAEEAKQRQELEAARRLAEERAKSEEKERGLREQAEGSAKRASQRLWFALAASVVVLLVAGLAGWEAWVASLQRSDAINQTQLANVAKARADENANAADAATKQAQAERDRARVQLLAMQARRQAVEGDTSDVIERAGALALESIAFARKINRPIEADAIEASRDALVRLPLQVLSHGSGQVYSLVALADGRLASAGDDGKIKIWPRDGVGEPMVLAHDSPVHSLLTLADGRLASGGDDGKIKIWPRDGVGGPMVLSHESPVHSLVMLADGRLASAGDDGKIKIWPKDGQGEPLALSHGGPVLYLAVLPDGRLASGGQFDEIKLWPRDGVGEPVVLPQKPSSARLSLVVLADGRLATGAFDGQITLWPRGGVGEPVALVYGGSVTALALLADGRLASGGPDGHITLWPRNGVGESVVLSHGGVGVGVFSLVVLADGRLASGGTDGTIKLWPADGAGEPTVFSQGGGPLSMAVLADGRLASGGYDGTIKLWPKDGQGKPVIFSHGNSVWSLAVLADGRLASGGADGKIKLWPKDGQGEPAVLSHGSSVWSLAVLPDGRLASGGGDGQIKLWPRDWRGEPAVLSHGHLRVLSLVVLPDGRLASGGEDGQIKLWPKDGRGEPWSVQADAGWVWTLVTLQDGRLASGSFDGRVKLWLRELGSILQRRAGGNRYRILPHGGYGNSVESLAVLADGRLASGGDDGAIKLWPKDEQEEPAILRHGDRIRSLAVLADGRLVSGGYDGKIKLWMIDEKQLTTALCLRAGRNLTKDEWVRYIGTDASWQPSCRDLPSNWRTPDH